MIYVVEDDRNIRELVVYTLQSTGFDARGFAESEPFFSAMQSKLPELVILDIMLPGKDGISILKQMRHTPYTKDVPVIMATAKGTEFDKVSGLDSGADDYITKPFGMMELVSRVKAVLRRSGRGNQEDVLQIGALSLHETKHLVFVGEEPVNLTLKEFQLLHHLMRTPGTVYTRDVLLTDIWGYDFPGETRTVDVHIRTLRQKLGACGDMIETVRGMGYRLVNLQ